MRAALGKFARNYYIDPILVVLFGIAAIFAIVFFFGFRYSTTLAQALPALALGLVIFLFVVPQRNISTMTLTALFLSVPFAHFAVVVVSGEGIQWAHLFGTILIIHLIVRLILGHRFPMAPATPWAIGFIGVSFMSAAAIINQPGEHIEEFWKSEVQLLFLMLMSIAITGVKLKSRHMMIIVRAAIILGIFVALFGIYQLPARFFGWPGAVIHLSNPSLSGVVQLTSILQQFSRASSIFSEPSYFGHYLVSMFALTLTAALHRPRILGQPILIYLALAIMAAALVACRAMSAFYMFAQLVLIMLIVERGVQRKKIVMTSAVLIGIGILVLVIVEMLSDLNLTQQLLDRFYGIYMYLRGDKSYLIEGESLFVRIDTANIALNVWKDHYLIGAGLGSYTLISPLYGEYNVFGFSANSLVGTLAEMGIAGLVVLLGFAISMLMGLWRIFKNRGPIVEQPTLAREGETISFLARTIFYLVLVEFLYFHVMGSLFWPSAWIYFGLAGLVTLMAGNHNKKVRQIIITEQQ
jgi:O-antigen ligase